MSGNENENREQGEDDEAPVIPFCTKLGIIRPIMPTIFLAGVTVGLPITTLPQLMRNTYGSNEFLYSGMFGGIQGFSALLFGPIVGALSDRFGRKPILVFCLALYSCQYLAYVLSGNNFWAYAIANAVSGYSSGVASIMMALVVDLVPRKWKHLQSAVLSYMMGTLLIGAGVGPVAGTFLGSPDLFYFGLAVCLFVVLVAHLTIPKNVAVAAVTNEDNVGHLNEKSSLVERDREEAGEEDRGQGSSTVVVSVKNAPAASGITEKEPSNRQQQKGEEGVHWAHELRVSISRSMSLLKRNKALRLVTLEIWFNQMADQMIQGLLLLYLNEHIPNYTSKDQMVFFAIFAFGAIIGLFFVVVQLKKYFGTLNTLRIALIFNWIGISGYGLVSAKWQVWMLALTGTISVGVYPTAAALIAGVCAPEDLGAGQGIGGGARMLAEGVSPFIFGLLLQQFKGSALPGAPFVIAGCFCLTAWLMTFLLKDLHPSLTEGKWVNKEQKQQSDKK